MAQIPEAAHWRSGPLTKRREGVDGVSAEAAHGVVVDQRGSRTAGALDTCGAARKPTGGRFCEDGRCRVKFTSFSDVVRLHRATMNTTAMDAPESTLVRSPQSRHQCGEFIPGARRSRFGSGWQAYRFFP